MKLYVAMVNDRHTDPYCRVFATPEEAIGFARATAKEFCHFKDDYSEETVGGWLFYARYSCEDDSAWVVEQELDKFQEDEEVSG